MPDTISGGPSVKVTTLDGNTLVGRLYHLTPKQISVEPTKAVPIASTLSVVSDEAHEASTEKSTAWIELVDGSKLEGANFTLKKGTASFTAPSELLVAGPQIGRHPTVTTKQCTLSTDLIRTVRFSKPGDPGAPSWPTKVGDDASSDLLVIRKKDAVDFTEGVVQSVDENHVNFKLDGDPFSVPRAKVDGLIFYHKNSDTFGEPVCVVEDANGWRVNAKGVLAVTYGTVLLMGPNDQWKGMHLPIGWLMAESLAGIQILIPVSDFTRLDFSAGKINYLSDMEPESVRWTPYLEIGKASEAIKRFYAPKRDEGREHQPLSIDGKTYAKGLALYSRTELEYRVPSGSKKLQATAGIDTSVRDVGHVQLVISADGKKLFDHPIGGSDGAVPIDLDVSGAKRLSILVDFGEGLDAGDYLNLADARIVK